MKGELLALAALALFSTNIIVTRLGSARLPVSTGYLISVFFNIVFAALLFGIELAMRPDAWHWDPYGILLFVLAGAFSTYLGRWFIFETIARLGPAKASAFQVSSPLFTFVIAWIFLGERLGALAIGGMLLTALGLLLVSLSNWRADAPAAAVTSQRGAGHRARAGLAALWRSGMLIGIGSSAAYAVGNVLRGAAVRQWNEAILGALIGAVTGIGLHFVFGSDHVKVVRGLRAASRAGVLLFAASGMVTICAQVLTISAMTRAPVAVVALITLCTPLVVFPISYFFLRNDEGIGAGTLAGAVLTIAGIATIILQ